VIYVVSDGSGPGRRLEGHAVSRSLREGGLVRREDTAERVVWRGVGAVQKTLTVDDALTSAAWTHVRVA